MSVSSGSVYQLFLPNTLAILQGLHGRAAFADFALVAAFIIVVIDPLVQIDLQLLDALVERLSAFPTAIENSPRSY